MHDNVIMQLIIYTVRLIEFLEHANTHIFAEIKNAHFQLLHLTSPMNVTQLQKLTTSVSALQYSFTCSFHHWRLHNLLSFISKLIFLMRCLASSRQYIVDP